jgi:hypothetical protein
LSTRRLRARLDRLAPFASAPEEGLDRDRRRYEQLSARKLKPGGLTDSEEVEFSKLDALFKDMARWEELSWKECLNQPFTEEEAREYAELEARLPSHPSSNEVQDDYEDIFGGYAEALKNIQSAAS